MSSKNYVNSFMMLLIEPNTHNYARAGHISIIEGIQSLDLIGNQPPPPPEGGGDIADINWGKIGKG